MENGVGKEKRFTCAYLARNCAMIFSVWLLIYSMPSPNVAMSLQTMAYRNRTCHVITQRRRLNGLCDVSSDSYCCFPPCVCNIHTLQQHMFLLLLYMLLYLYTTIPVLCVVNLPTRVYLLLFHCHDLDDCNTYFEQKMESQTGHSSRLSIPLLSLCFACC